MSTNSCRWQPIWLQHHRSWQFVAAFRSMAPEEIANMAVFLASDESLSWIAGSPLLTRIGCEAFLPVRGRDQSNSVGRPGWRMCSNMRVS
jgi:NAD(P)-dependent dehydrogenase (short-subunit alcohol dehydrogenase family)